MYPVPPSWVPSLTIGSRHQEGQVYMIGGALASGGASAAAWAASGSGSGVLRCRDQ